MVIPKLRRKAFLCPVEQTFSFPSWASSQRQQRANHNSWSQNRSCCHCCGFANPIVIVLVTLHPQQLLRLLSSTGESRLPVPPPSLGNTSPLGDCSCRSKDETYCQVTDNSFGPTNANWTVYIITLKFIMANERIIQFGICSKSVPQAPFWDTKQSWNKALKIEGH